MTAIEINGIQYFTSADICREIGVARQTLWRWRKTRDIPQGLRYRNQAIVFTRAEVEAIRQHSNRLEPTDSSHSGHSMVGSTTTRRRVMPRNKPQQGRKP